MTYGWWDEYDLIVMRTVGLCFQCGKETRFADLNFFARLHPQCADQAWSEYRKAMNK